MNDTQWHSRLADLAEHDGAHDFDVRDDLARGRARVRRTRIGTAAGSLLAAGLVGGIVLLGGAGSPQSSAPAGPAGSATPDVTVTDPLDPSGLPTPELSESVAPSPSWPSSPAVPALTRQERAIRRILEVPIDRAPSNPFAGWRNDLFATSRSVLDPGGGHLDYSTHSLQSSWSHSGVALGIKMGWRVPGRPGEGMVQVEVSSDSEPDAEMCAGVGYSCPRRVDVDGAEMRVGRTPGDGFVVLHRRPDGLRVLVVVDKLFGNNSQVAVSSMDVSRQDVYRLVQDERVDLPDPR